jgi:hypothetical protein
VSDVTVNTSNTQSITSPEKLHADPRVSRSWFYVFPERLLDIFEEHLRANRLGSDQMIRERDLPRRAKPLVTCVGFADGLPILDSLLVPAPPMTEPSAAPKSPLAGNRVRGDVGVGKKTGLA